MAKSGLQYRERIPPSDPAELPAYLQRELRLLARQLKEPASTTAEAYKDVKATVNTLDKFAGRQYWDLTTKRPVWATGDSPTDPWTYADGTVAYYPQ
jgi:hypothetical protein